ncbi:sulfatase, partial [Candidatus Sumerlaeota bacterium]|nr:sulfatase [Candidatus Sumerlaeota bacterium]
MLASGAGASAATFSLAAQPSSRARLPNFIVIFCDNLGYGDIGCYGSKRNRTPAIDRMAREGMRFTSFYVTSGVCTPSRASLMTGCYPRRINLHVNSAGGLVLVAGDHKGLSADEITLAEILKERAYATACIGKWHLGDQPPFFPTRHGFDYYFGIPYSDDMVATPDGTRPPLPLMRNEKVIEAPVDRDTLTQRYTEDAMRFIRSNLSRPFFLYLPHAMPGSTPTSFASERFRGTSGNGIYGDSVEEIDWSTGEILACLRDLGIDGQTLVVWTSDNGSVNRQYGSNAPLSGWGYTTAEGAMRMPCVMRWPGQIPESKVCDELCTTMDFLPTFARLAGTSPPTDRIIDGKDIWPLMRGQQGATSPHEAFYYYYTADLQAVRSGNWKLCLPRKTIAREKKETRTDQLPLRLYDLMSDIGEVRNLAADHPDVVARLAGLADKGRDDLGDGARAG